jgi:hypothetical protein
MDINKKNRLKDSSYFKKKYKKQQIVIGNSLNVDLKHFDIWNKTISGKYKGTSPYSIGLDGVIYEHYDPSYYSSFLNDENLDKKIISIILENEGWVTKDFNKKTFIMWNGNIYNRKEPLFERKWRGKLRWAPYSNEQMESLVLLCNHLTDKFNIPKEVSSDNITITDYRLKKGVYYRSNYSKNYLDVSPAFNFNYLKENVENDEKNK